MPSTLLTSLVTLLRLLPTKVRGVVWEVFIILFLAVFVAVMPRDMGGYGWHPPALAVRIFAAVVTFLMLLARANLSFNGTSTPDITNLAGAIGQFSPTALPSLPVPLSTPTAEPADGSTLDQPAAPAPAEPVPAPAPDPAPVTVSSGGIAGASDASASLEDGALSTGSGVVPDIPGVTTPAPETDPVVTNPTAV